MTQYKCKLISRTYSDGQGKPGSDTANHDRIAEHAIANSPKWKPAIDHNRKVKTGFSQPVTFSQE